MKLKLSTAVELPYLKVKEAFNESLFMKLSPPFPPVRLLRFDGCQKGDVVSLKLNFIFFSQEWESRITDDATDQEKFYFIDEGTKLPFFLKFWKHRHIIQKQGEHSVIIDDITFKTPFKLFDYLLYPALYGQFLYRKPIYKKLLRAGKAVAQ